MCQNATLLEITCHGSIISGKTQFDEEFTVALQLVGPGENIDKAEQHIRDKLEWLKVLHI